MLASGLHVLRHGRWGRSPFRGDFVCDGGVNCVFCFVQCGFAKISFLCNKKCLPKWDRDGKIIFVAEMQNAGVAEWQTHQTQNLTGATSCRFKSGRRQERKRALQDHQDG